MTTICTTTTRCPVCGTRSNHRDIMSTNAMGSPDLDTRPPEMQRSTMFAWINRCPKCSYCASNLSKADPKARAVVGSKEYQDRLKDPAYPELAQSFLCRAILDREAGGTRAAASAFLCAAWVCDDAGLAEQGKACRRKAAYMLRAVEAREASGARCHDDGTTAAILVDLLHRSGQVDEAQKVISEWRGGVSDDVVLRVLDFQVALLERGDVAAHTVAEALGAEA